MTPMPTAQMARSRPSRRLLAVLRRHRSRHRLAPIALLLAIGLLAQASLLGAHGHAFDRAASDAQTSLVVAPEAAHDAGRPTQAAESCPSCELARRVRSETLALLPNGTFELEAASATSFPHVDAPAPALALLAAASPRAPPAPRA